MKTALLPDLAAALGEMRDELDANRLEVVLVPQRHFTNEGGMIRCAVSKNAKWYRDFCASHASTRTRKKSAFDTRIRRANTLRTLAAILTGDTRSVYAAELLAIARARLGANRTEAPAARRAMTLRLHALA
jgi:hypothetical protein